MKVILRLSAYAIVDLPEDHAWKVITRYVGPDDEATIRALHSQHKSTFLLDSLEELPITSAEEY